MPSKKRYYYESRFDEEILCDDAEMAKFTETHAKELGYPFEVTEDMYTNTEYGEVPDWVDLTITDEGILPLRIARTMAKTLEGCSYVVMSKYFDVEVSKQWGNWCDCLLQIASRGGAYLEFRAYDGVETVEVNVTEQFNQAIGE
jgi:hypothetical protein